MNAEGRFDEAKDHSSIRVENAVGWRRGVDVPTEIDEGPFGRLLIPLDREIVIAALDEV